MHKIDWLNQPGFTGETLNPIRARVQIAGRVTWNHLGNREPERIVDVVERMGTHCEKVGAGCANCYAERHNGRCLPGGGTGLPYTRASRDKVAIYLDEDKLAKVGRWKKPRCIFWCSMTDLFGEWVPDEMLHRCLNAMVATPRHRHIILTKRPAAAVQHDCGGAWLLASASTQAETRKAMGMMARFQGSAVVGLSLEPLLEPIEFPMEHVLLPSWVIVGSESGPRRRLCKLEWVRSIVGQCRDAGVACFVKQVELDTIPVGCTRFSHDPGEWPEGLQVQQFPEPG